jgi:hypothetical protein
VDVCLGTAEPWMVPQDNTCLCAPRPSASCLCAPLPLGLMPLRSPPLGLINGPLGLINLNFRGCRDWLGRRSVTPNSAYTPAFGGSASR